MSLDVSDVLEDIDGTATLLVRAGKTDPDGRGAMLYLARDTVQLVTTWLDRGGVGEGRLFRAVRKDGTVRQRLGPSQVPRIYKRMARHAGLPDDIVDALAGHSTRVGPVQDMIASGIALPAILQSAMGVPHAACGSVGRRTPVPTKRNDFSGLAPTVIAKAGHGVLNLRGTDVARN